MKFKKPGDIIFIIMIIIIIVVVIIIIVFIIIIIIVIIIIPYLAVYFVSTKYGFFEGFAKIKMLQYYQYSIHWKDWLLVEKTSTGK